MSLQEKLTAMMARPGQDPVPKEDVPWWMRFAGRSCGTVGGGVAIFLGVWMCVSISPFNILMGLWQIVAGFALLCIEAPCCCMFIDHVQRLADLADNRPHWNRAALYCLLALPPIIFNFGVTSFLGSGLIFTTGILYGMMALGRKASAEEMRRAAQAETGTVGAAPPPNFTTAPSSGMRSNLVSNAQPISFTGAPLVHSKV